MALNPMHQFEVSPILPFVVGGFDLSITNQALWTGIATSAIILFLLLGIRKMAMVPGRMQAFVELTFEFVQNMTQKTAGRDAMAFFPLILTTFLFLAGLNLIGMIPHSFTATSQITTTAYMGALVFLLVVGVGVYKQGLHFFAMFLPKGTPWWLIPLMVPLEIISFLVRPATLAVRLAANMVAGHVLLKVFAAFCIMLLGFTLDGGGELNLALAPTAIIPLFLLVSITALEVFVALLQAYVFTVLTCVYLNMSLHGH
ncbi:MAG: F0F1 ATP synthase subunit A [Alphaproteobacteria bacterium]|nr:MAG: F0F1 ATP synthase subunit A [Alphaproteobacteria bacterium]